MLSVGGVGLKFRKIWFQLFAMHIYSSPRILLCWGFGVLIYFIVLGVGWYVVLKYESAG